MANNYTSFSELTLSLFLFRQLFLVQCLRLTWPTYGLYS